MKSVLALVLILCTIIAEGQVCVQVVWSEVNVRSSPCGSVVGNLGNGRKTTLRRGAFPTTCTLGGTSYNFVAISDYNGWVASDALQFCSSQCVRVDADAVNVRSSPCGTVSTQYKRNQQKTLTGTALRIATCSGKKYIWAPTSDGFLVTEYLRQCTASTPSPSPGNCNSRTKPARTGTAGLNIIKKWEGLRRCWYRDPVGYPTICYGHLIKSGEPYRSGTCLSTDQCTDLLRRDLPNYENCVKRYITVGLNQNQFDALVSFTFNLGCGSLQGSTLRKRLNRGEYSAVCTELKKWVYAGGRVLQGLVNRRNDECNLFRSCSGVARTGAARYCPTADECSACILNSHDQILDNYDLIGMNTTCGAESWKALADDYCTVVDPWDCYYKGPAGAINGTTICPSCNYPEPTFPDLPGEESNCINTGGNYCDPESNDCEVLLEGSTCDEFTGSCILPSANETFTNATYVPCEAAPEEESGASSSFLFVGMIASLLAVLFYL